MSTESDLAEIRLFEQVLPPGGPFLSVAVPIRPLRAGAELLRGTWRDGPVKGVFGRPGEVGGRASRAELTEWALRLCVERGGAVWD